MKAAPVQRGICGRDSFGRGWEPVRQATAQLLLKALKGLSVVFPLVLGSSWPLSHAFSCTCIDLVPLSAVNVTLDPASAHPGLVLSRNGKDTKVESARTSAEETFSVLGQKSITSGRHYWEVKVEMEVGNKATWHLGICRDSASRSGWVRESPEKGFWAVGCSDGIFQPMFSKQSVAPSLGKPPEQIGIFLDCEAGDVSFYNMTDGSHIYNFPPESFSGPVCPYFSIQTLDTSFTICGVSDRPESIPAPSLETPGTAQEQEKFLGDKNKALEEESTPTQSHSPPHYKPVSQHTK
ncbi:butyrophilin subfamily 3 member A3-like [Monodelphis domestica]|uniref:butyrophilin subfamily 3 member A3-like n=1 Tax=Monodelphis domestica TaxID=13616 RepID=UPI0024E26733|nr:butyrophilin subfamily 3 member A3-like [Monodelphis domestica]